MPATTSDSDGPAVSLSFANNFWGKEDAGVGPLLDRMHNAKVTSDELKSFYSTRAQIEEDYAKKILNLSRKPIGSCEIGTVRMSLDVVRGELESMGKAHAMIAAQMRTELEEPLVAFAGGIKERRKIVQGGIEKLLKMKNQQTVAVNKARDRFEQDCLKIKGYLAQGHMVMGQEERKNKAKLEKTQIQMSSNSSEYEAAVKVLEETTGRWNREWKAACDKFQDLEEERLDFFKSSLWSFANIASTVCVSDDQSCEKMRLSLEDCEVEKDITTFIKDFGTGQEIPDPPKYINFCRGDIDETSSTHESDDGNYSVAQFPRTMNPTYRTASPQPSTLESHHDPDSKLREEMGIPRGRTSMQGEDSFTAHARSSHGSISVPPPLAPSQSSMSSNSAYAEIHPNPYNTHTTDAKSYNRHTTETQPTHHDRRSVEVQSLSHNPYPAEVQPISHNPYPADGMTQFCRVGPPSERSSIPSPTRPSSRDSQDRSDYSAPTSFSSVEPISGNTSPTKHYNGSDLSGVSSGPDDKQIQKKKSGFFNSPFRRRSQKSKDAPQPSVAAPVSRNTWAPATIRKTEGTGSTKPFTVTNRASTWNKQPSVSPDPEPVDPRAEYQLGIGNNVFDVASPDSRQKETQKINADTGLDPIAQALAELKGVTKQATMRTSADRHYGMSTPAPGTPAQDKPLPPGTVPTPFASSSNRSTPPPAYDLPVSRLDAPQPAHTSREMQKTAERFQTQKRDLFNRGAPKPTSTVARPQPTPRATSPVPPRATSPRPFANSDQRPQQQTYRANNPSSQAAPLTNRPRAQSSSPIKQQPAYGGYASRGNSPGFQAPRAASPNPTYQAPRAASPKPTFQAPRAASPNPAYQAPRAKSPRPAYQVPRAASPNPAFAIPRAVSPNPAYPTPRAVSPNPAYARPATSSASINNNAPRAVPTASSTAPPISLGNNNGARAATSAQSSNANTRSPSSRGSEHGRSSSRAEAPMMALQLAPVPSDYGGERDSYAAASPRVGRPQSQYYPPTNDYSVAEWQPQQDSRVRSQSVGAHRQYSSEGLPILHYSRAMYMYQAAIPEELSFAKGDVLAVTRHQDDGWWEAEVVGKNEGTGLVPSNYLKNC